MPKGKNFMAIHPLVVQLCELVEKYKEHIKDHLGRNMKDKSQDHKHIDAFQKDLFDDLKSNASQNKYRWKIEKKANGRTVRDRVDIYGKNKQECCIIEIDATRIDQIAQKFVSRFAIYGLKKAKHLFYMSPFYIKDRTLIRTRRVV